MIFESFRLFAETGTDECLFLLATCYYRSGKVDQAFHILQVSLASSSAFPLDNIPNTSIAYPDLVPFCVDPGWVESQHPDPG